MNEFITAHRQVLSELEHVKKSTAYYVEDVMAKEARIKALMAQAEAIRKMAKEYIPPKDESFKDRLLKRWKRELEPTPQVTTKRSGLDTFDYSDKDINAKLNDMWGVKLCD
jgi:hypothetical protein